MKPTESLSLDKLAFMLFFTLLFVFLCCLFVILSIFAGSPGYSLFSAVACGYMLTFALFSAKGSTENTEDSLSGKEKKKKNPRAVTVYAPLSGKVIPLTEVADETFAEGIMGEGCAIIPDDDRVYSPVSGMIIAFFETHHAITVLSEIGAEILIHVGKDTVELKGEYFTPMKRAGDRVKVGEVLLSFDRNKIREKGYDITTPVTVANSSRYTLSMTIDGSVTAGDMLMTLTEN